MRTRSDSLTYGTYGCCQSVGNTTYAFLSPAARHRAPSVPRFSLTKAIQPRKVAPMFRRMFASLVVVSAVLAMTSTGLAAATAKLQSGSKVFVAPMAGFDAYFRAATRNSKLPLVFVRTRALAEYEITGFTKEVPSEEAENVAESRTTRQETTVRVTRIDSGQEVFQHSVRTLVRSPNESARIVYWATRSETPNRLLAIGKETAARRCVQAMQDALIGN